MGYITISQQLVDLTHLSLLHEGFEKGLKCKHSGVQLPRWVGIHTVEICTAQVGPVVAHSHTCDKYHTVLTCVRLPTHKRSKGVLMRKAAVVEGE